jgi:hypothetical protein
MDNERTLFFPGEDGKFFTQRLYQVHNVKNDFRSAHEGNPDIAPLAVVIKQRGRLYIYDLEAYYLVAVLGLSPTFRMGHDDEGDDIILLEVATDPIWEPTITEALEERYSIIVGTMEDEDIREGRKRANC